MPPALRAQRRVSGFPGVHSALTRLNHPGLFDILAVMRCMTQPTSPSAILRALIGRTARTPFGWARQSCRARVHAHRSGGPDNPVGPGGADGPNSGAARRAGADRIVRPTQSRTPHPTGRHPNRPPRPTGLMPDRLAPRHSVIGHWKLNIAVPTPSQASGRKLLGYPAP